MGPHDSPFEFADCRGPSPSQVNDIFIFFEDRVTPPTIWDTLSLDDQIHLSIQVIYTLSHGTHLPMSVIFHNAQRNKGEKMRESACD
jgi:hypothetical protein